MLSREVLDLMAQAKRFNEITPALDAGFKALTLQIANLQGQVSRLEADGVVTAEEKQQLMNTTSELAASFSTLQADIPAGTVAEAPPSDQPQTGGETTAPPSEAPPVDPTSGTGNPALSSPPSETSPSEPAPAPVVEAPLAGQQSAPGPDAGGDPSGEKLPVT